MAATLVLISQMLEVGGKVARLVFGVMPRILWSASAAPWAGTVARRNQGPTSVQALLRTSLCIRGRRRLASSFGGAISATKTQRGPLTQGHLPDTGGIQNGYEI